ncbi:MAG: lysylphosphatidylglycerol synthase domain-containing protein [Candidatus Korobacteraceae bacterium]
MSRHTATRRLALRFLAAIFGTALLAYLIWRVGPSTLAQDVSRLGWGLALVIALGGVAHVVKAWAWRFTLSGEEHRVSFPKLLQLRLVSEAVGQLGVFGQAFGEGLRASALSAEIPAACRISSVTLDRGLFIATGALVMLAGIATAPLALSLSQSLQRYAVLFAFTLIGLLMLTALAVQKRWPILSGPARAAGRLRYFRSWLESKESIIKSVECRLFEFHRDMPRAFWASFVLNLVCHGLAVLEVYLVLYLMGARISLLGALIFEALTKLVNVVGFFNPGNIGTYEGGNVLIAKMFRLSSGTGLALGLARRSRAIFWGAVGAVCMITLSRGNRRRDVERNTHALDEVAESSSLQRPEALFQASAQQPVAIILANGIFGNDGIEPSLAPLGTLPVILRSILGLQKAGAKRIIICVDAVQGPRLTRELLATHRLPRCAVWFESERNSGLPQLLKELSLELGDSHLSVIAGDAAYHPALLRDAVEWDGDQEVLALECNDRPVGIWALSRAAAMQVAERCPGEVDSVEQLHLLFTENHSVDHRPVEENRRQRVHTPEERISAERKLDHWLVKPTDGIFARMNRRISIPISRQLIRWPITPNMVSLFTLGVGFAAGVFFAFGGYLNVLFGAMLSVWASILDGSDGEVARLKLLESDFGCWLETICDYLYYLFIFAGMAMGMVRSYGPTYLIWSGLLIFGAVTSFLVTGAGRQRLAGERPEQYLKIWQAQAESRRSNPILYLGRHLEFLIRRCFLPYAFLFFAAINMMRLAFLLTAIGVNVVWLISLYSYRAFAVNRAPSASASAAAA